jgi:hypothetical protein
MGFWIQLAWALFFTVVAELLRPKQKPDVPQPSSLDDFDLPTADESRPIPVVFGRCKVDGANVTWYGDLSIVPIKKKVSTGLFSSSNVTIGYRYYLGVELFACHGPIDNIAEVRFGDQVPAGTRSDGADFTTFTFNDPNLFGGDEKEGGISGVVRYYKGTVTQSPNAYLEAVRFKSLPAYQRFSYAALEKVYVGTSAYIKPISFIIERYPNSLGLTSNRHRIGNDANPACMIYEILTDTTWGCAVPVGQVNVARLQAVGNTLYTEGLGLSMLFNGTTTARNLIDEILRHIDGVLYTDVQTGMIEVQLARADYTPATLPLYGPSEISELTISRVTWDETKNTVKVTYVDQEDNFTERQVQQQDLANITARNGIIDSEAIQFLGFSNATNANLAAARALKTLSYPLAKMTVKMNRKGWSLRPGSVFRLSWPARGIDDVVVRVIAADYGDGRSAQTSFEVVEDIFAVPNNAYSAPPPNGWTNPVGLPGAVSAQYAFEAPYQIISEERRYGVILAGRSGVSEGFHIYHDPAGGTAYVETSITQNFTPTGVLQSAYPADTPAIHLAGFTVQTTIDFESLTNADESAWQSGGSLALIQSAAGEEIVAWLTVTDNLDGTYTLGNVVRGVYDTVPLDHGAGARVWILTEGMVLISNDPYPGNGTVTGKLTPYNARGVLAPASAPAFSVSLSERARKPYPAGNVRVNGQAFPTSTTGDVTLSWAIRHRVQQAAEGSIVAQNAGDFAASPEGTFEVRVYIGGTLARTVTGLTAGPYLYTYAMRTADNANTALLTQFRLRSVNGGLTNERRTTEFLMNA